nr:uncharacterized protein LOC111428481 isoform X2 [Onthophagus taurus]
MNYFRLISFLMVLSVLITTSTTAPATNKNLNKNVFEIIQNPCHYNGHKIRHQRSTQDPAFNVRWHVNTTRRLTDGILKEFRRMYDKSKMKLTTSKFTVPKQINQRVKFYLKLQLYVKAIRMLTEREFESAGKIDAGKRLSNLTKLYNESTILLCEMSDDLHYHNLTTQQGIDHLEVPLPISNQSDRTTISIEDQGVLKHYKKFLIKLAQFYHPAKKGRRNEKGNKSGKNTRRKDGKENKRKGKKGSKGQNVKKNKKSSSSS